MTADTLPDAPVYCFVPVEDAELGVQQICMIVEGMDAAIGTSLLSLGLDEATAAADKLNRPLGWTRAGWTAFAAQRMRGGGAPD